MTIWSEDESIRVLRDDGLHCRLILDAKIWNVIMEYMKPSPGPLGSLDQWEDDVLQRYPERGEGSNKFDKEFRDYDDPARDSVREFYRLNHTQQTLEFARRRSASSRSMTGRKWASGKRASI